MGNTTFKVLKANYDSLKMTGASNSELEAIVNDMRVYDAALYNNIPESIKDMSTQSKYRLFVMSLLFLAFAVAVLYLFVK